MRCIENNIMNTTEIEKKHAEIASKGTYAYNYSRLKDVSTSVAALPTRRFIQH